MNFGVIGCGAVGLTVASKLGLAGHEVHIHSNDPKQTRQLAREEVDLGGVFDQRYTFKHVHKDLKSFLAKRYDMIFVAVKTPSLEELLDDLQARGLQGTPMMSCQNGIATETEIAKRFGAENAWRMVINFAGNCLEATVVKIHFFHPPNYISCLSPAGADFGHMLEGEFTRVGLETRYKDNIKGEIFQKVILNCSLSGVCALTRMTMGAAMSDEAVVDIVRKLLLEGMKIAHLEGANLGDDYFHNAMKYLGTAGNHKPSMLVDIENGLATEIEFLNYQLIKLAEQHGEFVPFTRSITALVRALDHTVRINSDGNGNGNG